MAVLVLDVDQAYETSAWGRRAKTDVEAAAREIEADNKRLEAQLTAEEQALTAERNTLAPDAFRRKAEEFDARAQTIRRQRAEVARDLGSRADADRTAFLNASLPVVTTLMQELRRQWCWTGGRPFWPSPPTSPRNWLRGWMKPWVRERRFRGRAARPPRMRPRRPIRLHRRPRPQQPRPNPQQRRHRKRRRNNLGQRRDPFGQQVEEPVAVDVADEQGIGVTAGSATSSKPSRRA